jgi:hypothetical protein
MIQNRLYLVLRCEPRKVLLHRRSGHWGLPWRTLTETQTPHETARTIATDDALWDTPPDGAIGLLHLCASSNRHGPILAQVWTGYLFRSNHLRRHPADLRWENLHDIGAYVGGSLDEHLALRAFRAATFGYSHFRPQPDRSTENDAHHLPNPA